MHILINHAGSYFAFIVGNNADSIDLVRGQIGAWNLRVDGFNDLDEAREFWRSLIGAGYIRDDNHAGVRADMDARRELRREKIGW